VHTVDPGPQVLGITEVRDEQCWLGQDGPYCGSSKRDESLEILCTVSQKESRTTPGEAILYYPGNLPTQSVARVTAELQLTLLDKLLKVYNVTALLSM
jgi:hypothetical protein